MIAKKSSFQSLLRGISLSRTFACQQRGQHTVQLKELRLKEFGNEIESCLELNVSDLDVTLGKNQMLVKLVNAPINPADLNIIQGRFSSTYRGKEKMSFCMNQINWVWKVVWYQKSNAKKTF